MYLLTAVVVIIGLTVILISNLELKVLALLVIVYTAVFTLASNIKLKGERLYIHENWILVPFALISAAFVIYGILKISGLFILPNS